MDDDVRRKKLALTVLPHYVGRQVMILRRGLGYTQNDIAVHLGINRPNLTNIENGLVLPTLETLVLLGWSLGVHPAKLVPSMADLWKFYKVQLQGDEE